MKRIAVTATMALLCSLVSASELWDRAVAIYLENQDLMPGNMTIRVDQYNGRGDLVTSEKSEIAVSMDDDGEVTSTILVATKDGKDITEQRRNESSGSAPFGGGGDSNGDGSGFEGLQRSPFDPNEQSNVTVVDTGRVEYVDGTSARLHKFEMHTGDDSRTVGSAWLSLTDGYPVRLEATISPLPAFVSVFELTQHFNTDDSGRWYMSALEMTAEGSFLFIRRRVESEFEFRDYFRSE